MFPSNQLLTSGIHSSLTDTAAFVVDDSFSVDLWVGDGVSETINNGIDISTEGGMVWIKNRSSSSYHHNIYDTARGATKYLATDDTTAEATNSQGLTSFTSTGFSVGSSSPVNYNGHNIASWSFKKNTRFFDIIDYTGDSSAGRTIAHNLGVQAGLVIVKTYDTATTQWAVQHRSLGGTKYLYLNTNLAAQLHTTLWNDVTMDDSVITLGTNANTNQSGRNYVAYVFAHDTDTDGVIKCGSYTGNGSTQAISLGWKPQFVLIKKTSTTGSWLVMDTARGMGAGNEEYMLVDLMNADSNTGVLSLDSDGFTLDTTVMNGSSIDFIYMAIREE